MSLIQKVVAWFKRPNLSVEDLDRDKFNVVGYTYKCFSCGAELESPVPIKGTTICEDCAKRYNR